MDSVLFWIDTIMNPMFATWFGLMFGTAIALMVYAVTVLITNRASRKTFFWLWVICVLAIWIINFGLIVWYNTPLGPSLNLQNPPIRTP
jgi:hypothetical protein